MELLAARAARVQNDRDFAWIVAGKQDGTGQGEETILTAAGNVKGQALTNADSRLFDKGEKRGKPCVASAQQFLRTMAEPRHTEVGKRKPDSQGYGVLNRLRTAAKRWLIS